ncbi:hypothetical protein EDB83DRAFT_1831898 [Lactarius deliciosus]|nr:hypothetical protein EDB83DRAFT_1831898 [Lactarius deliciosus]
MFPQLSSWRGWLALDIYFLGCLHSAECDPTRRRIGNFQTAIENQSVLSRQLLDNPETSSGSLRKAGHMTTPQQEASIKSENRTFPGPPCIGEHPT